MRPRTLLTTLAIATALSGCQKSAEQAEAEAARERAVAAAKAAAADEERARGEGLRASRAREESEAAAARAARQAREAAEALAREHDRYRALLRKEIAWIDRRLAELEPNARTAEGALRREKEVEVEAHQAWRARLEDDLGLVERAPSGSDWTRLKTKIERDLDLNRPAVVPRSYEKSYGI